MINDGEILWIVEQEIKDREKYRLIRLLKSMNDKELDEYHKKIKGVKK